MLRSGSAHEPEQELEPLELVEGGGNGTYLVSLSHAPAGRVDVDVRPLTGHCVDLVAMHELFCNTDQDCLAFCADAACLKRATCRAGSRVLLLSPPTLVLSPTNWQVPQPVVLKAPHDGMVSRSRRVIAPRWSTLCGACTARWTAAPPPRSSRSSTLADSAGIVAVSRTPGALVLGGAGEGGCTATYVARLTTEPSGAVRVQVSASFGLRLLALGRPCEPLCEFVLGQGNWSAGARVDVVAIEVGEASLVAHHVSWSEDPSYRRVSSQVSVVAAPLAGQACARAPRLELSVPALAVQPGAPAVPYQVRLSLGVACGGPMQSERTAVRRRGP